MSDSDDDKFAIHLKACPNCGVCVRVRRDGRIARHTTGRSNVAAGGASICESSETRWEEKKAALS
jgi:hypothetical protein